MQLLKGVHMCLRLSLFPLLSRHVASAVLTLALLPGQVQWRSRRLHSLLQPARRVCLRRIARRQSPAPAQTQEISTTHRLYSMSAPRPIAQSNRHRLAGRCAAALAFRHVGFDVVGRRHALSQRYRRHVRRLGRRRRQHQQQLLLRRHSGFLDEPRDHEHHARVKLIFGQSSAVRLFNHLIEAICLVCTRFGSRLWAPLSTERIPSASRTAI